MKADNHCLYKYYNFYFILMKIYSVNCIQLNNDTPIFVKIVDKCVCTEYHIYLIIAKVSIDVNVSDPIFYSSAQIDDSQSFRKRYFANFPRSNDAIGLSFADRIKYVYFKHAGTLMETIGSAFQHFSAVSSLLIGIESTRTTRSLGAKSFFLFFTRHSGEIVICPCHCLARGTVRKPRLYIYSTTN